MIRVEDERKMIIRLEFRGNSDIMKTNEKKKLPESMVRSWSGVSKPVEICLRRKMTGEIVYKDVSVLDNFFELEKEWDGETFTIWIPPVYSARTSSPMDVDHVEKEEIIAKIWEHRVYMVQGDGLRGSSVLVSNKNLISANHLGFEVNKCYKIRGVGEKVLEAKCLMVSKKFDLAIIHCDELPELDTRTSSLGRGQKFMLIGYPDGIMFSTPSISSGTIEGLMADGTHLSGAPGSRRGLSGGAVLDQHGLLAGILLGGSPLVTSKHSFEELFLSECEQKVCRILPIMAFWNAEHISELIKPK